MPLREQDRHFFWSLYAAVAVIFAWKGLWDVIYLVPFIPEAAIPFYALALGSTMLVLSGAIFKEFDPLGGLSKAADKMAHQVYAHPEKHHFKVKYHDKVLKKEVVLAAEQIQKIERGALIFKHRKGHEVFVPLHRITEVLYKGKSYWRF